MQKLKLCSIYIRCDVHLRQLGNGWSPTWVALQNGEVKRLLPSISLDVHLEQVLVHPKLPSSGLRHLAVMFVNSAACLALDSSSCQLGNCSGNGNERILQSSQLYCATGSQNLLAKGHFGVPLSVDIPWYSLHAMETNYNNMTNHATAFRLIDASHDGTGVTKSRRNPYNTTYLSLGAWNVRTTNDSADSIRPERATAIICRELEKANIDICALSEVRRPGTGNLIEKSHTIFWSGNNKKEAGVGFAISNNLFSSIDLNPKAINDRLMSIRIELAKGQFLTLISAYGPTMQRSDQEKESFYESLGVVLDSAKHDKIIILGDLNARVGRDWHSWPSVIGKHGVGNMNTNGLMLLEFCTRFQFTVMGTMFQLKNSLKNTWQHLRSRHWHQIDHVLANKNAKQHITVTKVNLQADCFTDHKLLVCKCKFAIKQKKKGLRPPRKRDTNMTSDKKEKLEQFLNEKLPECAQNWEDFKNLLQQAAEHIFDKKRRTSYDWFDENDQEIQKLLKEKKTDRNALRDRIRILKNEWFQTKAIAAEQFAHDKNYREFYSTLNQVYGPRSKNLHPIKSKNNILLTSSIEIKDLGRTL